MSSEFENGETQTPVWAQASFSAGPKIRCFNTGLSQRGELCWGTGRKAGCAQCKVRIEGEWPRVARLTHGLGPSPPIQDGAPHKQEHRLGQEWRQAWSNSEPRNNGLEKETLLRRTFIGSGRIPGLLLARLERKYPFHGLWTGKHKTSENSCRFYYLLACVGMKGGRDQKQRGK